MLFEATVVSSKAINYHDNYDAVGVSRDAQGTARPGFDSLLTGSLSTIVSTSLDQLEGAMAEILQTVDQQSQIRERAMKGKGFYCPVYPPQ